MKLQRDIEITEKERIKKKQIRVLRSSGIYEAHTELMKDLAKHGCPKGNIYEFCASQLLVHEKRL